MTTLLNTLTCPCCNGSGCNNCDYTGIIQLPFNTKYGCSTCNRQTVGGVYDILVCGSCTSKNVQTATDAELQAPVVRDLADANGDLVRRYVRAKGLLRSLLEITGTLTDISSRPLVREAERILDIWDKNPPNVLPYQEPAPQPTETALITINGIELHVVCGEITRRQLMGLVFFRNPNAKETDNLPYLDVTYYYPPKYVGASVDLHLLGDSLVLKDRMTILVSGITVSRA